MPTFTPDSERSFSLSDFDFELSPELIAQHPAPERSGSRLLDGTGPALRVIPSEVPSLEMLRNEHCQLVISPRPPDGADILQKRLFEDRYRVFYDPTVREPPRTRAAYLAASHATVVYEPRRLLDLDQYLAAKGIQRRFAVMVPGFAGLPPFIRGSDLLATAPGRLQSHLLRDLASVEPPLPCPPMPMYMVWHARHQVDAAHRWLRGELEAVVAGVVG